MIKIIKEGKKLRKTKPIYTITCPHCGCVFECEISDFHSMSRGLDGKFTVYCPNCEMTIEDSRNTVPTHYTVDIIDFSAVN